MNLIIELEGDDIKLVLKDGRKVIGEANWEGQNSLAERLLPEIDRLLKKNQVSKEQVTKVQTKIGKLAGVTSARIVETVAKSWNAAISG